MAETKATEKDGSWYSGCQWSKHITLLLPVRQTSHSNLSLGDIEVCHVMGPKAQPAYNFTRPLFSLEPVPLIYSGGQGQRVYLTMHNTLKWGQDEDNWFTYTFLEKDVQVEQTISLHWREFIRIDLDKLWPSGHMNVHRRRRKLWPPWFYLTNDKHAWLPVFLRLNVPSAF